MLRDIFSAIIIVGLIIISLSAIMAKGDDISNKVEDLISRMTLEEKVGQLQQYSSRWAMTGPVPDGEVAQEMHKNIYRIIRETRMFPMNHKWTLCQL